MSLFSRKYREGFVGAEILVAAIAVGVVALVGVSLYQKSRSAVLSSATVTFNSTQVANQDGNNVESGGTRWIGTGQDTGSSYLGIRFSGGSIPQGVDVTSAEVKFTPPEDYWISIGIAIYGENSGSPAEFSNSNKISDRSLTGANNSYSDNVKWSAGQTYSYDVTNVVQELVNNGNVTQPALIIKGTGDKWGRKFINGSATLVVNYDETPDNPTATATTTATTTPTAIPTLSATVKPTTTATAKPTASPTPASTGTPTPLPSATVTSSGDVPAHMQRSTITGELIYGVAPEAAMGTCSATVHDRYVTRGPDGRLYRTWHPATVQIDPDNPSKGTCTFGHEHGENPALSNIYNGPVPFSYIGSNVGIDMPHVGYKCYVQNKGAKNDEGRTMQHDAYFCFHMGTAGTGRYTARFHELYFFLKSASGYEMKIQGLADTGGNAGTICDNPRHGRTVQGFGCKIDSSYEIWADDLSIRNQGNTVAFAEISTAVFDPITTMDPSDLSRVVYSWDPEVQQKVYKFGGNRTNYRGCDREAYSGPISWYNRGGSTVYYTDAYGNVVNGGPLKQEISSINTSANSGYLLYDVALRMTESSNAQTQFKLKQNSCVPGLGILN